MQKNADKIKDSVLGPDYELSLVFIDSKISHELNYAYRKKDNPTNILSFPLSKTSGEIFIDLEQSKKEFVSSDGKWRSEYKNFSQFITFLFIHGLLHLKGMRHGSTMEKAEHKFYQKFKHVSLHRSRN